MRQFFKSSVLVFHFSVLKKKKSKKIQKVGQKIYKSFRLVFLNPTKPMLWYSVNLIQFGCTSTAISSSTSFYDHWIVVLSMINQFETLHPTHYKILFQNVTT